MGQVDLTEQPPAYRPEAVPLPHRLSHAVGSSLRPVAEMYADLEEPEHAAQALSAIPGVGTGSYPRLRLDPAGEPEAEGLIGGQGVTLPSATDVACSWRLPFKDRGSPAARRQEHAWGTCSGDGVWALMADAPVARVVPLSVREATP